MEKEAEAFYVCSLCECAIKFHYYFYACPLLDNEVICVDCCMEEVEKDSSLVTLKEIGKPMSREEINKICSTCKKRCMGDKI